MAKIDKDKDKGGNIGIDKKDIFALNEITKEFTAGRYGEDDYVNFLDGITKKIKKDKKFKGKDTTAKEIEISATNSVTDYERSYLKQIANQIYKDLRIRVNIKF